MFPTSMKIKLVAGVTALVVASGLTISLWVTHNYGDSLINAGIAQAESLAHAVALESAERVLINDLVALQKMLDHQMRSNPNIAYMFVVRDGRVLAHTFPTGVPKALIESIEPLFQDRATVQKIVSLQGEQFADIAWPIFSGRAGFLRLGFSEKSLRKQVMGLWLQMSLATLVVLVLTVVCCLFFAHRITRPLAALAAATRRVKTGDLDTEVAVHGSSEVAALASSFNDMVKRLREHTTRLEQQAKEIERSHNQTLTFCEIVREIGAMPSLHEIGPSLIARFRNILVCNQMAILVFNEGYNAVCVLSEDGVKILRNEDFAKAFLRELSQMSGVTFLSDSLVKPPTVSDFFRAAPRQAIVPFSDGGRLVGGLVIACLACDCDLKEVEVVGMILSQAAGVIKRAILQEESIKDLQSRLEASSEFRGIVGKHPSMQAVYRIIEDIASTDSTVLIQGESGTGKELVARAVHESSDRRDNPFVVINCSAYPETLLESELFGHERGAFTGAIRRRAGRFEQADGGTVFLDEIGEIQAPAQIKLLRVLQTQSFERIGGDRTLQVNVRILAATNKELSKEVQQGRFREDLFYRLNVIPIFLPPLRERNNDIPLLAKHFLRRFALQQAKDIKEISPEAIRMILEYSWPGNVRELENSIEHAVVLAKGNRIEAVDLPAVLRKTMAPAQPLDSSLMLDSERALLERVLAECDWNKKRAARRLGIGRSTLYAKLKRYQLSKPTLQ
ncbi:MAG: sigma 54-interacting transcriptional regulator [Desulfomonile tiedjei]|uniref:Sigma 54-interacting transcriptional regulator n=1 Tax=Desulfomonile tiedjei TaxID=2358 RepID=A0A9D6Z2F9_9BACT|nr:sigma 54-interacting transcriptional regulator [Desulfomonile tiedjei]